MSGFEVERTETLTREEAVTRLRRIANLFSSSSSSSSTSGRAATWARGRLRMADHG